MVRYGWRCALAGLQEALPFDCYDPRPRGGGGGRVAGPSPAQLPALSAFIHLTCRRWCAWVADGFRGMAWAGWVGGGVVEGGGAHVTVQRQRGVCLSALRAWA